MKVASSQRSERGKPHPRPQPPPAAPRRTLCVIPARLGATRLPDKPLRLLAGVPIIVRVMERVAALKVADRIVVAADSQRIIDEVREAGGDAVLTSPAHPSGTDRVAEVSAMPAFAKFDFVLNVQGDEPFVSAAAIRDALDLLRHDHFEITTAAVRAPDDILQKPDVVKVVTADDRSAMYFSRAPIPFLREQADVERLRGRVLQHVGIYAYTPAALAAWVAARPHPLELIERLEQLRPLAAGQRIGVAIIGGPVRGGIDTEADLVRANKEWTTFTVNGT